MLVHNHNVLTHTLVARLWSQHTCTWCNMISLTSIVSVWFIAKESMHPGTPCITLATCSLLLLMLVSLVRVLVLVGFND